MYTDFTGLGYFRYSQFLFSFEELFLFLSPTFDTLGKVYRSSILKIIDRFRMIGNIFENNRSVVNSYFYFVLRNFYQLSAERSLPLLYLE